MAELKYPLSLVIRAVDRVTAPLNVINQRLEKSASRFSAPFRRLGGRLGALSGAAGLPKLMTAFQGVGAAAGGVGSAISGLGTKIAGMVGGALFSGYGLYSLAKGAIEAGDRIGEISQRVGLGVDAFAQLEFAAAQMDVGPEAFAGAMDRFNKGLGEMKAGGGSLLALLSKVSPNLARQVEGAKGTEAAFGLMTKAFEKVTDPGKRAALAAAAFGKSGLQMGQFLGQGSKAIDEQRHRFLELAGSQEALAAGAGGLDNAMREAETAFLGLRNATMTALFPALTTLAGVVAGFLAKNRNGLQQWAAATGAAITAWVDGGGFERLVTSVKAVAKVVGDGVDKLGGLENVAKLAALALGAPLISSTLGLVMSLGSLGAAVAPVAVKLGTVLVGALGRAALGMLAFNFGPLIAGLGGAMAATWAFTAALLANPITWVVAGIAALAGAAYLIYDNWEPISKFFKDLWGGITNAFMSAWTAIKPIVDKVMTAMEFVPGIGTAVTVGRMGVEHLFGDGEPRSSLGAAGALPARGAAGGGDSRVQVDFSNLPRGARVTTAHDNSADLDLSWGFSMVGP